MLRCLDPAPSTPTPSAAAAVACLDRGHDPRAPAQSAVGPRAANLFNAEALLLDAGAAGLATRAVWGRCERAGGGVFFWVVWVDSIDCMTTTNVGKGRGLNWKAERVVEGRGLPSSPRHHLSPSSGKYPIESDQTAAHGGPEKMPEKASISPPNERIS